jgi:hypothetical protein
VTTNVHFRPKPWPHNRGEIGLLLRDPRPVDDRPGGPKANPVKVAVEAARAERRTVWVIGSGDPVSRARLLRAHALIADLEAEVPGVSEPHS